MKKKFFSLFIAVELLITLCTVNAYAAHDADETVFQRKKLGIMIATYEDYENVVGEGNPYDSAPADYYETWDNLCSLYYRNNATSVEYRQAYETAYDLVFNRWFINYDYAEQTYQNALNETYSAYWYTNEEWNDFQGKLSALGSALEMYDELSEQNKQNLTDAFHGLLKAYNVMTNHSPVVGDVSGDKKINVQDVTAIQRHLAGLKLLNGAQKLRAAVWGERKSEEITIMDVTRLQEYMAEFTDNVLVDSYSGINYPVFVSEVKTNPLVAEDFLTERLFNFAICPRNDCILYDVNNGFYCGRFFAEQTLGHM